MIRSPIRFTAGHLCPVDICSITIHYQLQNQFKLSLINLPTLRQGESMWTDRLYWISEWIMSGGDGNITVEFFLPWLN